MRWVVWFHTTGWGSLRSFCQVSAFVKLAGPADSDGIGPLRWNHFPPASTAFYVIIIISCLTDARVGIRDTLITITGTEFASYFVGI